MPKRGESFVNAIAGISSSGTCCRAMYLACAIAKNVGNKKPTAEWLQKNFGMSRATAYRWRNAWCIANGENP